VMVRDGGIVRFVVSSHIEWGGREAAVIQISETDVVFVALCCE
jgi:hypothetical protein